MITSLIEMLELLNFRHMTTSAIQLKLHDKILLVTSWTEIMSSSLLQITFILRRPGIAIFAEIIKTVTMFIKSICKDSKLVKKIRNYISKCNICIY